MLVLEMKRLLIWLDGFCVRKLLQTNEKGENAKRLVYSSGRSVKPVAKQAHDGGWPESTYLIVWVL